MPHRSITLHCSQCDATVQINHLACYIPILPRHCIVIDAHRYHRHRRQAPSDYYHFDSLSPAVQEIVQRLCVASVRQTKEGMGGIVREIGRALM
jgi:hypothetical protein